MYETRQPNILYIMSDDHAAHAMGCYGSVVNETPNIDRIAREGVRLENCFCTNSICTPSRATVLTGQYSHRNGVRTLADRFDGRKQTFPKLLQAAGYQTAVIGKWHLGHGGVSDPTGFDYWNVLPGQGEYHDPEMIELAGRKVIPGYATDIITDFSLGWLRNRSPERPFLLMCHHKAPHRPWDPDEKHARMYEDGEIPKPDNYDDDYRNRASAAQAARMRVDRDLNRRDLKADPPPGLSPQQERDWKYQRYMQDYLRCVASLDDNVGRLLDYLDEEGLTADTIVVYTSDQGFFLGEHGWYDKRFMYEESLRMPFVARYPREIEPGSVVGAIATNVDFAPTFLDYAGIGAPSEMQGTSMRPVLHGEEPHGWQTSTYYRYWMHLADHGVYAHYGVRTRRYKLIHYYGEALDAKGAIDEPKPPEWELFDLEEDPTEMNNVYGHPEYSRVVELLKAELYRLRAQVGDDA